MSVKVWIVLKIQNNVYVVDKASVIAEFVDVKKALLAMIVLAHLMRKTVWMEGLVPFRKKSLFKFFSFLKHDDGSDLRDR